MLSEINPLLLIDFYKATHHEQYPAGMTKLVSYYTPRMSRIKDSGELIMFGLQGVIKEYLTGKFNENFFGRPKEKALAEYRRVIDLTLGAGIVNYDKIGALHDLGYLPIEIRAISEGTLVPVRTPMFAVTNTHPDFAWLTNTIETLISASLWHTQVSANAGYRYRKIVNKYYEAACDDDIPRARAVGDFSMRGQESCESAIKSSAAFLLSFLNTATVPAIMYLEEYYNCNIEEEPVGYGAISTEHSVMNANFAVDGNEEAMIKRLLTEIYPDNGFSMVSDSYDYWNLINNILPNCKEEIIAHNGYIGLRGDSGDPVEIVTDTVFRLWEIFGGTVNSKGYKVLNAKVKAIYGDSITPSRLERIYKRLIDKGFACNNVLLGSGSFSMQCLEEEDIGGHEPAVKLNPYTRDTYGIAIKATYCEVNGKAIPIFKDPKTDGGNFKKSQKGCCAVYKDENGKLNYRDGLTWDEASADPDNLLETVFKDGVMIKEQSLSEIRERLYGGKF